MKISLLLFVVILSWSLLNIAHAEGIDTQCSASTEGAMPYYTLVLPQDFVPTGNLNPCHSTGSILVTSPDTKAVFYFAFSATGNTLAFVPEKLKTWEKLTSQQTIRKKIMDPYGNPVTMIEKYGTITGLKNVYKRSYYRKDMIWSDMITSFRFAFTYRDKVVYKKYLSDYLAFKKSFAFVEGE